MLDGRRLGTVNARGIEWTWSVARAVADARTRDTRWHAGENAGPTWVSPAPGTWQEAHAQLCSNARRRGHLDADEAKWLREAERLGVWKQLGMVTMPAIARAAVEEAWAHVGDVPLEQLLREALRRCPRPRSG